MYDYCAFDVIKKKIVCLGRGCGETFDGHLHSAVSAANKHIQQQHELSHAAGLLRKEGTSEGWWKFNAMVAVVRGQTWQAPAEDAAPNTISSNPRFKPPTEVEARQIDRAAAAYVCLDGQPYSATERPGLQLLAETIRPGVKLPARRTVVRHVNAMDGILRTGMLAAFQMLPLCVFFAAALDLWSTKAAQLGFLGVVLYFIDGQWRKHVVTVGVEHLPGEHTLANVKAALESFLEKAGVPSDRLAALITDGGSNVAGLGVLMGLVRMWCYCHRLQLVIKVCVHECVR